MSLGKNILKLRKDNQLSQEQLAQKCNVSRQTISRWESDEVLPDTNNLITLSKLFNVTLDSIVFDEVKQQATENKKSKKNTFNLFLSIILVFSFICNIGFIIKDYKPKNSIYGEWVYKENGYEVKLTLSENKEIENYDNFKVYLFYKDVHQTVEYGFDGQYYEYPIQNDEFLGVRYKFKTESSEFYYNDISNSITLILNRHLNGKAEFVLKKMK